MRIERQPLPVAEAESQLITKAKEVGRILDFYMFPFNLFLAVVFLWNGTRPARDE